MRPLCLEIEMKLRIELRAGFVGFDVTELAPAPGPIANAQLADKLTYRIIGLALRE